MVRLLGEEVVTVNEGELAQALERADDHRVVFERDGIRYRIVREGKAPEYDPEALKSVLYEYAGFLSEDEAAEMKEYLRRGREEGSRDFVES